jgi:hypothetical protein
LLRDGRNNQEKISDIIVTFDSHNPEHIAHTKQWINGDGKHPDPFTQIKYQDVKDGTWKPQNPDLLVVYNFLPIATGF